MNRISVSLNGGCPITKLTFYNVMDDAAMIALAVMLKDNSTLKYLFTTTDHCTKDYCTAVAGALKVNDTLLGFGDLTDFDSDTKEEVETSLSRNKELAKPGRCTKRARVS